MSDTTLVQRYIRALGEQDWDTLTELYDDDVVFYTPLKWGIKGVPFIVQFCKAVHLGFPGVRVALHDEFYDADGTRAAFRFVMHWHNTGPFLGHEPTGERGTSVEAHTVRIRDGRITEQVVAVGSLHLPHIELVRWAMDFPRDTVDPSSEILSAPTGK
ncbi:nuclear transport factor 2 family protein [Streptomyces sp. NPDC051162]|uniref:ester cyclase n=1 Tax=unclassified Streptomyces TaxID=2593676 RepID=UPI00344759D9